MDASDARTMRARARGEALEHGGTIPASAHGLTIATNGVRGVPVRRLIVFFVRVVGCFVTIDDFDSSFTSSRAFGYRARDVEMTCATTMAMTVF